MATKKIKSIRSNGSDAMNSSILQLRLFRQGLIQPFNQTEYDQLFRDASPVPTKYWTMPGDPPLLTLRSDFDEVRHNNYLRANRTIIKGRFQKGNIGYIFSDELAIHKAVYEKPMVRFNHAETTLLELLRHEEALSIGQMKEITGWLAKDIAPVLHSLQAAFLVYEDQRDGDWERRFFLSEREFPDQYEQPMKAEEALSILLRRALYRFVWMDDGMARDLLQLPKKDIAAAFQALINQGIVIVKESGYLLAEDEAKIQIPTEPIDGVWCLNRNDWLVRAHQSKLKHQFIPSDGDVLYYLLMDGWFQGYVSGAFKNGPFEARSIVVLSSVRSLSTREAAIRNAIEAIDPSLDIRKIPLTMMDSNGVH
jgi:hypothetical protein